MNDLQSLFHRLRDEELARVPPFRAARRPRVWRLVFVPAALVVIVLGIAVFHHRPAPVTESIVTWKAPTDFLLRTPGSELLTSVPRIPDLPERK